MRLTVSTAYPSYAGKCAPTVQHALIIEDYTQDGAVSVCGPPQQQKQKQCNALTQDVAWLELKPVFDRLSRENLIPLPRCRVPLVWRVLIVEGHHASVVVVPPHPMQLARHLVYLEDRVQPVRRDGDPLVAASVPGQPHAAEHLECFRVFLLQNVRRVKSIHKQGLATEGLRSLFGTEVNMGQKVEGLEPSRVGEVGRVGVRAQGYVRVRGVGHGKVGYEVVETAIVCLSNKSDLLEKFLSRLC